MLVLPKTSENLRKIIYIGLSLLRPGNMEGKESIAGMMYACEYWGCVAGGGGWQACGDIAYNKWGYH